MACSRQVPVCCSAFGVARVGAARAGFARAESCEPVDLRAPAQFLCGEQRFVFEPLG